MREAFRLFAEKTEELAGSPWAFIAAVAVIVIWGATGPLLGFSQSWHILLDAITILTFLMLFLLQNGQNRDAKVTHLKLNELIRAMEGAHNSMLNVEKLSDDEIERLELAFRRLRERHAGGISQAIADVEQKLEGQSEPGKDDAGAHERP